MSSTSNSKTIRYFLFSVFFFSAFIIYLAAAPPAIAKTQLAFSSSGLGGTWYPCAAGLADIWNKGIPEINVTVETSGGGQINPKKLSGKQVDIALTVMDMFDAARAGRSPYQRKYDMSGVRCIIMQHSSPGQWVVPEESTIRSLSDLKGKRVATGMRGSAGPARANLIFDIVGFKEGDVKIEHIGKEQSAEALADGRIDAFIEFSGAPTACILSLSMSHKIRFLELTKEQAKELQKRVPFFSPSVVKAGTYKGQTKDFVGYGAAGVLQIRKEVPDDVVYKMCKIIDENWESLYKVHKLFRDWRFDKNIEVFSGQPLHPGALKFYKEKGIIQ